MTAFFLLSGAGNDFIALADPDSDPTTDDIRRWCQRGVGVGADGVLVLSRGEAGTTLRYSNADGSSARLCINGTRCAARLSDHLGWTAGEGSIHTGVGILGFRARGRDDYEVDSPPPSVAESLDLTLPGGATYSGWRVDVGVPHFAVLGQPPPDDAFTDTARALRHHETLGPAGANVDFATPVDGGLRIRSYERGVEAETLACGTGALAVAAAAVAAGSHSLPLSLQTRGGFVLEARGILDTSGADRWSLAGDARLLAEGHLLF